jgi:hypothetical protein
MATYDATSPYFDTQINSFGLGLMANRTIPKNTDDRKIKINLAYQYRPDLLANDLYGDHRLWWVFAARNSNTLQDPLNDFAVNKEIYVPSLSTLKRVLGF